MAERAPQLVVQELLQRAATFREELAWEPFRPGIQIHRLYQDGASGPAAALLRYQPGSSVPLHEHIGYEHIFVLDGAQSDEHGTYPAGTFVINPPKSSHRVVSEAGCVVLMIWEKGIRFLGPTPRVEEA